MPFDAPECSSSNVPSRFSVAVNGYGSGIDYDEQDLEKPFLHNKGNMKHLHCHGLTALHIESAFRQHQNTAR